LCAACREKRQDANGRAASSKAALCFQCYRLELERTRKIQHADELDTASEARFQGNLPFEPVNTSRLVQLKAEREQVRVSQREGSGSSYTERRRRAQIAARHALERIVKGLRERNLAEGGGQQPGRGAVLDTALVHAAELQLPEAWLPFVVAR